MSTAGLGATIEPSVEVDTGLRANDYPKRRSGCKRLKLKLARQQDEITALSAKLEAASRREGELQERVEVLEVALEEIHRSLKERKQYV